MFCPTKTYRRWHRKVNKNQRRFAIVSALAASASTALVLARGHRVEHISEIPLVISNETIVDLAKTSSAVKLLKAINAFEDVERVKDSKTIRAGKGKLRNRRYVQRRGPLIIYDQKSPLIFAFRNIPGIELCSVNRLNLLQLAPGGHLGRFIIWTAGAYKRLEALYGSYRHASVEKSGYKLPRPMVTNSDLGRLINSSEVQSVLRQKRRMRKYPVHKKNPLKNLGFRIKLNPYAKTIVRKELRGVLGRKKAEAERIAKRKLTKKQPKTTTKTDKAKTKTEVKKSKVNSHKKAFVKNLHK